MLSRTAQNLYWLARYIERAENMARLLDVGQRMNNLSLDHNDTEWESTIIASGCRESFFAKHDRASAAAVIHHLTNDLENPSSIMSCLETARSNARAVRTALTTDAWEAINATHLQRARFKPEDFAPERVGAFLEWVKERSLHFSGATNNTMMRNDGYWFVRLGTFIERADNTARILDVKYHVLLPEFEAVGGTLDYYQWTSILRSVSALRAYHWMYRDRLKPWLIAEMLILRREMPRSLASCMNEIMRTLDVLAEAYGSRGEAHRLAGQLDAQIRFGKIDAIFKQGLHEFLTRFIDDNMVLGQEISNQYLI